MLSFIKKSKDTNTNSNSNSNSNSSSSSNNNNGSSIKKSNITNVVNDDMIVEIIENERLGPLGWSYANLMPDDPRHFVSTAGNSMTFPKSNLDDGWEYIPNTEWHIDYDDEGCDNDGWFYAATFKELDNDIIRLSTAKKSVVRRKVWIREVRRIEIIQKVKKTAKERAIEEIHYGINHHDDDLYDRDDYHDNDNDDNDLVDLAADGIDGFELASDDGKDNDDNDDDDDNITSFFRRGIFGSLLGQSNTKDQGIVNDSILRIKNDQELLLISKKIIILEEECKKNEEIWLKEWTRNRKAILKFDIKELDNHYNKLIKRVDKEANMGLDHANMLDSEIKRTKDELEKKKREYFFPLHHLVIGDSGIYAGLDDIILDHMSGNFNLKINPSKDNPSISILITGKDSLESGISINLKADGFQLKGDKGKGIPRLRLESIGLNIVLRIDITIKFNVKKNSWETSPEQFNVQILSFKGPLGTSKLLVGATLKLLIPIIRYQVLNALPHELGDFIKSLPSAVNIHGDFSILGTELKHFTNDLKKSTFVCKACGYSSQQVDMFQWLQLSLDRPKIMKTMTDILAYRRLSKRHPDQWKKIVKLWDQAAKLYCDKVIRSTSQQGHNDKHNNNNHHHHHHHQLSPLEMTITFQSLINVADELSRKKLITNFNLRHLDGQASVNQLLKFGYKFLNRITKEAALKAAGIKHARIMLMLDRIKSNYEQGLEGIKLVSRNLDFAQLKLACGIHAGPEGKVEMTVANIYAQAPVVLSTFMSKDKNLGGQSALVPIRLSVKPQETGEIIIEVQFVPKNPSNSPRRESSSSSKHRGSIDSPPRRTSESFHSVTGSSSVPEINAKLILKIAAMAPHFSIILDKPSQFKQGAELFTIALGPRDETALLPKDTSHRKSVVVGDTDSKETIESKETGCPILVKTAPNVKFLAQVPKAQVGINLPNLIEFAKAHFVDVLALKDFLELSLGGEFYEEQLLIGQVVIDRVSKYLLSKGVDIDLNINGKVIALGNEIMIRIEASNDDIINPTNVLKKEAKNRPSEICAVKFKAAVYLMDLIEDGIEIDKVVKQAMGIDQSKLDEETS